MERHIDLPLTEEIAKTLRMGDNVYLTGVIYTARDAAHERMTDQLEQGISVFIFPEGTRSKAEEDLPLLSFHEGSFRIATRNNRLIVPVAICNTAAIFEKQQPAIRSRNVSIEFCEPIDPSTLSRDEKKHLGEFCSRIITTSIITQQQKPVR